MTGNRASFAAWLDDTNDVTQTFLAAGGIEGLINLGGGLPDASIWPVSDMAELARSAVADRPAAALAYGPIDGLPALRDLIAARHSTDRLKLTRENVLVTTAGMQGLDLLGKVFIEPGDTIAAQSPAYLGAIDAWKPRRPAYRPMRLGSNAVDFTASMEGAKFAYTVPNFSNPSGRLVSLEERRALLDAAGQTGCWLVEDDPYGALYYDDTPLPSMLEMSGDGTPYTGPVIYLGTVSKELAPGLRVGWVIAAPEVIRVMTTAKQGSDMCTSGVCQQMTHDAFASGLADRILPDILSLYRERRDALSDAMANDLSDLYDWDVPSGGMFIWATAKDATLDTDALMAVGLEHGVCISPSSVFDPEGRDRRSIRINFTANPPEKLREGIVRLGRATRAALRA